MPATYKGVSMLFKPAGGKQPTPTIILMITTNRSFGRTGICECVPHLRMCQHTTRTTQQVTAHCISVVTQL
jgi:hypothetical protein